MLPKAALTFLVVGVLSVNALTIPVARSPTPEPESQALEAWMLKRDLSYDLFSRELRALDELFSREPEDWAEWAKRGIPLFVSPPSTPPPRTPSPPPSSPPGSPPPGSPSPGPSSPSYSPTNSPHSSPPQSPGSPGSQYSPVSPAPGSPPRTPSPPPPRSPQSHPAARPL